MRFLIYVHSPTWFTELSLLGKYLRANGHDVLFYIVDFGHWTMREFGRRLAEDGIQSLLACDEGALRSFLADPALPRITPPGGSNEGVARAIHSWLHGRDIGDAHHFRTALLELSGAMAEATALIRRHKADVVLLGGDNPGYSTSCVVEACRREDIPCILVPSTMSNGIEEAEVYAGDPTFHVNRLTARLVARLFPNWAYTHNGIDLLRCVPGRALALETLSLAPPEPWAFNSGYADCIAAESQAMIDYAAAAGLPRKRMLATGSPSDDLMLEVLKEAPRHRANLCEELGLPPSHPILLTALPPNFFYVAGGRPQCDFRDYSQLIDFWIDTLARQTPFNVVVSLHPSVEAKAMAHIERPNVKIAGQRTAWLIPLCDIYVASVSSTIRWAIACSKPVINYDVYRYRYTDFLNINGVKVIEEQNEFQAWVEKLTGEPGLLAELQQQQGRAARHWGFLDGRCCERIMQTAVDLSRKYAAGAIVRPEKPSPLCWWS